MDLYDEDVSARVLLRSVLNSERPSSAVARRRSHRLQKSDAGRPSPQVTLRQKLKHNLEENISIQRRTRSSLTLSRKVNTPAVTSRSQEEDDITPRGLLRGVLRTEPELSLLVPDRPVSEEAEPTDSSLWSNGLSLGVSGLELPDLPTVNLTAVVRGISRKRPRRKVNQSVFEREITDQSADGSKDQDRDAMGNLSASSSASASSLNLTLKTPLVDMRMDRLHLQRRVGKRKALSVDAFERGIDELLETRRNAEREQTLNDTTTSDLDKSSTVLYSHPVSTTTPHIASVSLYDRDTVTATQIQREVEEEREQEEEEQQRAQVEKGEERAWEQQQEVEEDEREQEVEEKRVQEEEREQQEEEEDAGSSPDDKVKDGEVQGFDEDGIDEGVKNAEEAVKDGEEEGEAVESEREEEEQDAALGSNLEKEEEMEEEMEEEGAAESGTQEEEVTSEEQVRGEERVSRRACHSERVVKIPGMATGGRSYRSLSDGLQVHTESEASAGRAESGGQEDAGAAESEREDEEEDAALESDRDAEEEAGTQGGGATESQTQEEEVMEEEATAESETQEEEEEMEEEAAAESGTQEEEVTSEEQVGGEERVSRRACHSERVVKIPGMAEGGRGYRSLSDGLQVHTESEASAGRAESGGQEDAAAAESEREDEEEDAALESDRDAEEEEEAGTQGGGATESQTQEEEVMEEEAAAESETQEEGEEEEVMEEEATAESETQEEEGEMEEEAAAESGTQEEEVTSEEQVRGEERVSRRACHSERVVKIPGMAEGGRGYRSLSDGLQVHTEGGVGWAEPGPSEGGASREWHSGPEEGSQSAGVSAPLSPSPAVSPNEIPPSPAVSPNEIPPSPTVSPNDIPPLQESLLSSGGRGLCEVEERVDGGHPSEEEENSIPPPELVPPEMSPRTGAGPSPRGGDGEQEPSEEEEEDEEEGGADSEELFLKTPAFIRKKNRASTPGPAATPTFLKQVMQARKAPPAGPAAAQPRRPRTQRPPQENAGLSRSFIMSTFKHFAKTTVSSEAYPVLKDIMDKYFDRLADDLEVFSTHAKRKTIEVEDVELLMRRQGFVSDSLPVNVLIERFLPHEYRKLLIPMATSGNKVVPRQRR